MLGWPYLTEVRDGRAQGTIPPEPVTVQGDQASLAGSDWRVLGYATGYFDGQEPPPEGLELVDVAFRVTPGDEEASTRLQEYCRFRAVDGRGREWERTPEYGLRDLTDAPGDIGPGCGDAEGRPVAPGTDQAFVASFLVPQEVVTELRYEVTVNTSGDSELPRPQALLFTAEPVPE